MQLLRRVLWIATLSGLAGACAGAPAQQLRAAETRMLDSAVTAAATAPAAPAPAPAPAADVEGGSNRGTFAATERPANEGPRRFEFRIQSPLVERERTRAMVLTYHSIDYTKNKTTTTPESFESHLERMRLKGMEIIPVSFLIEFLEGKRRLPETVAVITVDDGAGSFFHRAYPLLLERKVPFALALIGNVLENPKTHGGLTPAQVRTMIDSGLCEVLTHGYRHIALQAMPRWVIREELIRSRDVVEKLTGFPVIATVYPLGSIGRSVRQETQKAGYRAGFRAQGAGIAHNTPLYALPRYTMFRHTGALSLDKFPTLFAPPRPPTGRPAAGAQP